MDAAAKPEPPVAEALVQEGFRLQQEGALEAAEALFRQALALEPGHFAALFLLAECLARRGEHGAAALLLEQVVQLNPGFAAGQESLGRALWHLRRPEEALAHLGRAVMLKPDSVEAHLNRGIVLRELGRPDAALASLDRALALQPGRVEALLNRAAALLDLAQPEAALAACDQVLAQQPDLPQALLNRANALLDLHRPGEALATCERGLPPDDHSGLLAEHTELLRSRGNALLALGRTEAALASYDLALARAPGNPATLLRHGLALLQLERPGAALERFDQSLALQPGQGQALLGRGFALWRLGRAAEALACYEEVLVLEPDNPDALVNRGNLLMDFQRPQEALASYERALALRPEHPDSLLARGNAWLVLRRLDQALADYDRALALQPEHGDALVNRGNALLGLGRAEEALASCERALALQPGRADAGVNRAVALLALRRPQEALDAVDRLLALRPDHLDGVLNRGTILLELKRPTEALACFERALALRADDVNAWMNRGSALHALARHQEALDSYDRALQLKPDHAGTHSNKIFVRDFLPGLTFEEHQSERRRYWQAQSPGIPEDPRPFANERDPERRLVLGYVSADFKHHSAASAFGPVLRRHDADRFKVVCYSGVQAEDGWTREFRQRADAWRAVAGLSDAALAEQIRSDRIDILIDLSGHSKGNRLPVFGRRPAPVQVTAWGHGGGTGLPAMDYQFTDPVYIPERHRALFAEVCWDLPCCLPFEAPEVAPEVLALPALARGQVTFGSLQRFSKVSPAALASWAGVLARMPGSRLLLKDVMLDDPGLQRQVLEALAGHGIAPDRVEMRGATSHWDHLAAFNDVDIVLDTFPNNGGISTWEALWMGVPVLALLGGNPGSRVSAAILTALGLDAWVAPGEPEYLELALRQAADPEALARFRAGARARIAASAAGDPERYTRAVEAAYRAMWRRWLEVR